DVATAVALGDGDGVAAGVERLGELLLTGLEGDLRALLLGDVAEGRGDAHAPVDAQEAAGYLAGKDTAVAGAELRLDVGQGLVAQQLFEELLALLRVGPEAELRRAAADDLLLRPAKGLAEGRVDLGE